MTFLQWLYKKKQVCSATSVVEDDGVEIQSAMPLDPAAKAKADWQHHVQSRHGGKEPEPGHCKYLDNMIAQKDGTAQTTLNANVDTRHNVEERATAKEVLEEDVLDANVGMSEQENEQPSSTGSEQEASDRSKELIPGYDGSREVSLAPAFPEGMFDDAVPVTPFFSHIYKVIEEGSEGTANPLDVSKATYSTQIQKGQGDKETSDGLKVTLSIPGMDKFFGENLMYDPEDLGCFFSSDYGLENEKCPITSIKEDESDKVSFFVPVKALEIFQDTQHSWTGYQGLDISEVGSVAKITWKGLCFEDERLKDIIVLKDPEPLSEDEWSKITLGSLGVSKEDLPAGWIEDGDLSDMAKMTFCVMLESGYSKEEILHAIPNLKGESASESNYDIDSPRDLAIYFLSHEIVPVGGEEIRELKAKIPLLFSGDDYGECCLHALSAVGTAMGFDSVFVAFEDVLNDNLSDFEYAEKKKIAGEMWKSLRNFKTQSAAHSNGARCYFNNDIALSRDYKSWNGCKTAVYHELGHSVFHRLLNDFQKKDVIPLMQGLYNAAKEDFSRLSTDTNLVEGLKNTDVETSREYVEKYRSAMYNTHSKGGSCSEDASAFCDIAEAMNGFGDAVKMFGHGDEYYHSSPPPGGWNDVFMRTNEVVANITAAIMNGKLSLTRECFPNLMSFIKKEIYSITSPETEEL